MPKKLDEAVNAIGTHVSGVQGDIAQLADLDRLYETVGVIGDSGQTHSQVGCRIAVCFAAPIKCA